MTAFTAAAGEEDVHVDDAVQLGAVTGPALLRTISGHQLETTTRILETYMPRDHAMAASAIVATIGGRKQPELAPAKAQR